MASRNKRMFSMDIIDSDEFLELPVSSQNLYFHLSMRSDDDGFITPKKIMRMTGAKEDDMKILIAKKFLLAFESGVVVIKHWLIHNTIRHDRYIETNYLEEKNFLNQKDNKAYTLDKTKGKPLGNHLATEKRREEKRIGKGIDKDKEKNNKEIENLFEILWEEYGKIGNKKTAKDKLIKILKDEKLFDIILQKIKDYKKSLKVLKLKDGWAPNQKHFSTWIGAKGWEDDYQVKQETVQMYSFREN